MNLRRVTGLLRGALPIPLAGLLAGPALAFDPWREEARYEFIYRVDLGSIPAEEDDPISLWIPLASEGGDQRIEDARIESPLPFEERRDGLGNRMLHLAWTGPAAPGSAVVATTRLRRSPSIGTPASDVERGSRDDPQRYLKPQKRIPLDGLIEQIAVQESRGLATDADKIRAFYDYVVTNMRYAKDGEGWGRGDAIWACTEKYGNCTDFHSLFLGMARSQGVPARFVIGFPIPVDRASSEIGGYHCWAEAWDAERGWVPFDASEAWKAKRFDDYFGQLPSDRVAFTIGRDLVLAPPQRGEPLNYFVYPYAEVGGQPVEALQASYSFRRIGADTAER